MALLDAARVAGVDMAVGIVPLTIEFEYGRSGEGCYNSLSVVRALTVRGAGVGDFEHVDITPSRTALYSPKSISNPYYYGVKYAPPPPNAVKSFLQDAALETSELFTGGAEKTWIHKYLTNQST